MHVLNIHNTYLQQGGEDIVAEQEASLLRERGHRVDEYRRTNHEMNSLDFWRKLKLPVKAVWANDTRRQLQRLIEKEKPDVAHFHNTFLMISPAAHRQCAELGIPVIQTLHNYRLMCPNAMLYRNGKVCEKCVGQNVPWSGLRHACYHSSYTHTGLVTAVNVTHRWLNTWNTAVTIYLTLTEFAKQKFIQAGLPQDGVFVKPNFIHPDSGERDDCGGYAVFVGRLTDEKGLLTLLKAWQRVNNVPLKILGDGPKMSEARIVIKENKLENVELLGKRSHDETIKFIKGAYCLMFPSQWYEGFPMTIVEAFACGVPVIASRLGAMTEIVEDRRTGLHFNPGDPDDLAAKVEWAWGHEKELKEMGKEARREFEEKYTADKNYKILMEIYSLARERAGGSA